MHLTQEQRNRAVAALAGRLKPAALREVIPPTLRKLVAAAEGRRAASRSETAHELAEFLVDYYGTALLEQADIRGYLCESVEAPHLLNLREAAGLAEKAVSRKRSAAQVADRRWYKGKAWARYFTTALGFPLIFAGSEGGATLPPYEEVEAYVRPPELYPYQKVLCDQVLGLCRTPPGANRAIVSLPTGAGKTRTVVEALVRARTKGILQRPYLLWVAQSEELCEQAVATFRSVWQAFGSGGESLRVQRLWGGRPAPPLGFGGVIVASIQKLHSLSAGDDDKGEGRSWLGDLGRDLAAVVIDEAHHATAQSYTTVLKALGIQLGRRGTSSIPLIGLTATPYRSDSETRQLVQRFDGRLLSPWPLHVNPIEQLYQEGILARAVHEVIATDVELEMTEKERESLRIFSELPDSFVRKIGADAERNQAIVQRLLELNPAWPLLFFGCSVEHACAMAMLLRRQGVNAAVVTGATSASARRAIIEDFRAGRIQVLCNYGILTTGFDAPGTRVVVVARPTASCVLYEQMIGRGMRGPKLGGTEECLIIDFADNLERFGVQMAHTRFAEYWQKGRPGRQAAGVGGKG